jgi:MFS family permease
MKQRTLLKSKRKLFNLSAWKEAPYVLFVIGRFTGFVGLFVPFFTSTFAMGKTGATQQLAFYLIPILNATSTFGRRIPGFVADRFGLLNVLILCTFTAGILAFSWIAVHDIGGIIVFAVLYGFFSGTLALRSPHYRPICVNILLLCPRHQHQCTLPGR